jgi:DNA mismatch endonuclease (patch repair protein)
VKPSPSSAVASDRMRATRQVGTSAEEVVALALRQLGVAYVQDRRVSPDLRCRPDFVILENVAIFVDGCFWHSCPQHSTTPTSNRDWWLDKLESNRRRDARADRDLRARGWHVVRFWEHDAPQAVLDSLGRLVEAGPDSQSDLAG